MNCYDRETLQEITETVLQYGDWARDCRERAEKLTCPTQPWEAMDLTVPNPEDFLNDLKTVTYTETDRKKYLVDEICDLDYEQILRVVAAYVALRELGRFLQAPGEQAEFAALRDTLTDRCREICRGSQRLFALYQAAAPLWGLEK